MVYSRTLQEPRGQLSVQETWPLALMNAATVSGLLLVSRLFHSVHGEEPLNIMNRYAAARSDIGEVAITHSKDDRTRKTDKGKACIVHDCGVLFSPLQWERGSFYPPRM